MCTDNKSTMKIIFFGFNFVLWIAGFALLGVGIWMRVDVRIGTYLHVVNVHHSDPLIDHASLLFLIVGVLTFLVGLLGCCGILRESQPMLFAYVLILVLLLITQIAASVLAVMYRKVVESSLGPSMTLQVQKHYFGPNDTITKAWDYLQMKGECCGAEGPTDYNDSNWFVNGTRPTDQYVPMSCCVMGSDDATNPQPENPVQCQLDAKDQVTTSEALHIQGCISVMTAWFHTHSWAFVGVGFTAVLIQLIGCILAIRLRSRLYARKN